MTNRAKPDEHGVILIALLWILVALSVIALSFSRESLVEVAVARNTRDLADAYYVARAGLSTVIYRLLEKRLTPQVQGIEVQQVIDPIDLGVLEGGFGGGFYRVDIQDETGKINLNLVQQEQMRSLLDAMGIPKEHADVIVDSLLDWKDADKANRANGAEDDYYQSLPRAYKAKNGRMDSVEELLLVRGVTPDYFYGRWQKAPDGSISFAYGLSRYLSVYSTSNRINVNYAELPVLLSVPGMTSQAAEMIYARRKERPFKNIGELTKDLPVTIGALTLPFLGTDSTGIYTLTAAAHMENSKVKRVIRTTISLDQRESSRYKVIYWNENVPNF